MGAGPSLLLLAGLEGSPAIWGPLRAALVAAREAQGAPPLPIHAARPTAGPSLQRQAEAIDRPTGPLLVVGASYGGLLGWAMSANPHNNVMGVILIESLPCVDAFPRRRRWEAGLAALAPPVLARALWRRRIDRSLQEDGATPALRAQIQAEALPQPALMERLGAIHRWGLPERPACPALWVLGAGRRGAWPTAALRRAQPEAALRWLPGRARPQLASPEALAALVLAGLSARPGGLSPW
jgi:pimeloyl-ACP methyl ester carboxylesterase